MPYKLEMLGKADSNSWANDSVFVQFSGSVTASGGATWRIGTTSATEVNLEDCSGCGDLRLEVAGQRLGPGCAVHAGVLRGDRHPEAPRPDARRRHVDRPDPSHAAARAPQPPPPPPPQPSTARARLLKVLDWNTHHGIGTDGVFSLDRFVPYIVKSGANVVSLNEVEKNVGGSYGNVDAPARYAALLKTATGKTWYYKFAQRDGNTNGQGNLILTTFPIEDSDDIS